MKNILKKSILLLCACALANIVLGQGTALADLNFAITSSTSVVPSNYVYSTANTPNIKTQNNIKCIIISDGGGSNVPTFNDPKEPTGGKRWMAFCPAEDCEVKIGVMSNKKKFYIQSKSGEFFSYTNTANKVEEVTVKGLKANTWYAMCGANSQVYITEMTFTSTGTSIPPKSSDATLSELKYNGTSVPNFSASTTTYSVELPASFSGTPTVSATTTDSKATTTITQATAVPGTATVNVTAEDGTTTKTYTITFTRESADPSITAFTIAGVNATIDPVNHTICATVKNGTDVTNLTPTVTGKNIQSYTPQGAQNFTNPVTYTVTSATGVSVSYTVTITVTPPMSSDATLKSISIDGTPLKDFASTTYSYTYELPAGTTKVPPIIATATDSKAKVDITSASALPGATTITVTAEDGTQQVYTINFTVKLPSSDLTIHYPEIYEADTRAGGYGGTLTSFENREYEVYYAGRNASSKMSIAVYTGENQAPADKFTSSFAINEEEKSCEAKDGWLKATISATNGLSGGAIDEFKGTTGRGHRMSGSEGGYLMHISGYDQFSIYAKDKKTDTSDKQNKPENNRHFEVYIDGIKQQMTLNTSSVTVRRFDITTGEHIIEIKAIGSEPSDLGGFSLRVSDAPRVKYVSGDDKTQVINQTKTLQPVTYAIRNYVSARLEWVGAEATGITLSPVNATGDTLQVSGTANCPVGEYTYKVVGLDKNNAEASSCTGTFRVQTEVRATDGDAHTVWINDPMTPVTYEYDALDDKDVTFSWGNKPDGVDAKQDNANNQWAISGTPTKAGTYNYTLTAAGGNTLNGTLTVDIPDPMFIAPANASTKVKATQQLVPVVWTVKFAKNVTVTGLPTGVSGTYSNGTFTLSGTPAAETTYPQTYIYTLTAEPLYEGKNTVTKQGQIIVIDPAAKSLLYLYDDNYNDGVFTYLNSKYDVSPRRTDDRMRAKDQYDMYDVVVISENVDATNEEVLGIIKTLQKPVLNMEVFTYTTSRLGWGYPDNGSGTNTAIQAMQPSHPVFKGMNVKTNDAIEILDQVTGTGIMPTDINLPGSYCLATAIKRGDIYEEDGARCVAIHEVPKSIRGGKYILLPVSQKSQQNLTVQGKRLIDNIISYLVDPTEATIELPELRISSFKIDGIEGKIDETALTIRLTLPAGTNLTALIPEVQIVSNATIVTPSDGETVDFSDQHYGVNYTVSDFINKKVYKVFVNTLTGLEDTAIDSVWFDGNMLHNPAGIWLNIYDIMGRLLTVTNADMDMTTLPTGVYLLQSSNATMKIVRN